MNSLLLYLLGTLLRGTALWLLLILLLEKLFHLNLGRLGSRRLWWGMLLVMILPLSIIFLPVPKPVPPPAVETVPRPPVMETVPQPQFEAPAEMPDIPLEIAAPEPQKQFQFPTPERLAGILAVVYIVIAGILLSYRVYQMIRWRHCLRGCAPVFEPRLLALFERARRMTGTEKLRVSLLDGGGCIDSPACGGIIKPYILFPVDDASKWCDGEISMLLIHELSHVRRRDYVWNSILYLVEAFYWFNPVFRVIRQRLSQAWETDCDSAVIKSLGLSADERGQYARLLMDFAIRAGARRATPVLGAEGNVAELKLRIKEIMSNRKFMRRSIAVSVILLAAVAAGLLIPTFKTDTPPEVATGDYQPTEEELKSWSNFNKITQALIKEKKYEEALKRYQWFFDHILEYRKGYYGVRGSYTLKGWFELGLVYPPAMAAMVKTRDDKVAFLKSDRALPPSLIYLPDNTRENVEIVHDVISLNKKLNDTEESAKLIEYLDKNNPSLVESSWPFVVDMLLKEYKYDLVRKYDKNLETGFGYFLDRLKMDLDFSTRKSDSAEFRLGMIINEMREYQKRAEIQGKPELAERMEKETRARIKELLPEKKAEAVKKEPEKSEPAAAYAPPELQTGDWKNYVTTTQTLAREGKYDEALKRYQWGFEHISEHLPPTNYTEFYLLQYWGHLAMSYPPAKVALIKTRDAKVQLLKSDLAEPEYAAYRPEDPARDYRKAPPSQEEILKFREDARQFSLPLVRQAVYFNKVLEQNAESIELLKYFEREKPFLAYKAWYYFLEPLLAEKADDLLRKYDSVQLVELDFTTYSDHIPGALARADVPVQQYIRDDFTKNLRRFQQRAEVLKNPELAASIQESITKLQGLNEDDIAKITGKYRAEQEKNLAETEKRFIEREEKLVKSGDNPKELENVRKILKITREARQRNSAVADRTPVNTLVPGTKYVPPELKSGMWNNYSRDTMTLISERKYEEALARCQWVLDNIPAYMESNAKFQYGFFGLIRYWGELGRAYPKARQTLIEYRQVRENYIRSFKGLGTGRPDRSRDWTKNPPQTREEFEAFYGYDKIAEFYFKQIRDMNEALGDKEATIRLFRYLDEHHPNMADANRFYIMDVLVDANQTDLVRKYGNGLEKQVDRFLDNYSQKQFANAKNREQLLQRKMGFTSIMGRYLKQAKVMEEPELVAEINRKNVERLKEIDQWIREWKAPSPQP